MSQSLQGRWGMNLNTEAVIKKTDVWATRSDQHSGEFPSNDNPKSTLNLPRACVRVPAPLMPSRSPHGAVLIGGYAKGPLATHGENIKLELRCIQPGLRALTTGDLRCAPSHRELPTPVSRGPVCRWVRLQGPGGKGFWALGLHQERIVRHLPGPT